MKFLLLAYLSSLSFAQEKVAGLDLKEAQRRLEFTKRTLEEANQLNADKHNAGGVADATKAVAQLQAIVDKLSGVASNVVANVSADAGASSLVDGQPNRGGNCNQNAAGGLQGGLNGFPTSPEALKCQDRKDSNCTGKGFEIFDDLPFGPKFTTSPCEKDEECCTSCCDGTKCRAPDALKGDEKCRNGLQPKFDAQGQVSFVKAGGDKNAQPDAAPDAGGSAKCEAPSILFDKGKKAGGVGFDNRDEPSFKPSDDSHGSAKAIRIIAEDICNKLKEKCDRAQDKTCDCKTKCDAARAAAEKLQEQGQAAADAFNEGLGL